MVIRVERKKRFAYIRFVSVNDDDDEGIDDEIIFNIYNILLFTV